MKTYDRYILILTSLFLLTTIILAVIGEVRLDLYFLVYLIAGLVLTELYIYLNPKAKKALNKVNYVLFAGFLVIVASKTMEILWGIKLL